MQKYIIILILAILTNNCRGTGNMKTTRLKIDHISSKNQLFKEGMTVEFIGNYVRFQEGDHLNKYPVIISEDKMVIETCYTKWLFEYKSTDSVIILSELYSKNPLVITLKKIDN